MEKLLAILVGILPALCFPIAAMADQISPQALAAEIEKLGWRQSPGVYQLSRSKSTLALPEGMEIIQDADARRFLFLTNGTEFPETEAVVFSPAFGITTFAFADIGFVRDGDWSELDPDGLLERISEGVEESNEERVRNGYPALHVKGWATEPWYDAERRIAFWALELQTDAGLTVVNSTALKMGRYGFMQITLIVPPESVAGSSETLETILATHAYDDGQRYVDFQDGDKVATLGLAALVAAVAAAKLGKGGLAALLAVLFVFLKKGWVVIVAVLAGASAWLKRRKKQA